MIIERDGKFFEKIEVEKEISEIEYLKRKVKELEEKVSRLEARPGYIPYIPCPVYPEPYRDPYIITWTAPNTSDPLPDPPYKVTCNGSITCWQL